MLREENGSLRVSFVIPSFNAADAIAGALESVVAQTCGDWEAVVVDDGSSDGTYEVAEGFATADARFRVVKQANAGVSCARNTAIRVARGEYLAFLDADDSVEPDFVEKLSVLVSGCAPDVLALAYRAVPRGNTFGYGVFDGSAAEFLIRALSDKYATFPCWMFAISRRFIAEHEIAFTEGRRTGEDQEFVLKALCAAETCRSAAANEIFYLYRTASETSAMGRNLEGQFDYPKAMLGVLGYFKGRKNRLTSDEAREIESLLADRFVGACHYAAEMALANGAADEDVLVWVEEVLEEAGGGAELDCGQLKPGNRMFLGIWLKAPRFLPRYVRARTGAYRMGRGFKRALSGKR